MPLRAGGGGGGTSAKDELGNAITKTGWLATHQAGDRSLVQGLKGDPTYLIVNEGWVNRRIWFICNLYSFRLCCPMG